MPTAATLGTPQRNSAPQTAQTSGPVTPFIRASAEHTELIFDQTAPLTSAYQDRGVMDVNAYGYARAIVLVVQATGGSGTNVTSAADGPFNVLQNVSISEPGGAPIAQFADGYQLAIAANKYGAYNRAGDPRQSPNFSGVASGTGNFSFVVRIPIEINPRNGFGALANQNGTAPFKLRYSLAPSSTVYGTAPTTMPNVRVRAYLEAWDQPLPAIGGQVNETEPPANNTTQFYSFQSFPVTAGVNTFKLSRVGNYIRRLTLIYRDSNGSRTVGDANWPSLLTLNYDARPQDIMTPELMADRIAQYYGFGTAGAAKDSANGQDAGVWVWDFAHEFDGRSGFENNDLWLPTEDYTRLELTGTFGTAGTLTVITNDVAVAGGVLS